MIGLCVAASSLLIAKLDIIDVIECFVVENKVKLLKYTNILHIFASIFKY